MKTFILSVFFKLTLCKVEKKISLQLWKKHEHYLYLSTIVYVIIHIFDITSRYFSCYLKTIKTITTEGLISVETKFSFVTRL